MACFIKILFVLCLALPLYAAEEQESNLLDVETPTFFTYTSPLSQPDSLRNRPYFDFLSTLYRRDADKSSLFLPYQRDRRAAAVESVAAVTAPVAHVAAAADQRQKRAVIFRPLFVYRQQQIKKQELRARKYKA